jgi:ligand-binding sensor domain-containing protein
VYNEQIYRIAELVGAKDAHPTWIAASAWNQRLVSGELSFNPEIWTGTNGYGIVLISPEAGTVTRYTTADGLPGDVVRDIDVGADIWVATGDGVGRWDGEHWMAYSTADGLPSNDIRGVAAYRNTVWAATAGGAAYFDGQSWQAFTHENGLPEGDLNGVRINRGEIWFSTRRSGLLVFVVQTTTQ